MNFKKQSMILLALVGLLSNFSCEKEIFDCGNGEGIREVRTISLDDIHGFDISESIVLLIKEGETQSIEINSYPNLIEKILDESKVKNGIWEIAVDNCLSGLSKNDVEITATISALSRIEVNGSAEVKTLGQFNDINNLDLEISGSGEMDLNLGITINSIQTEISGSGRINISGTTDTQDIEISGSGDYNAFDLISRTCTIEVSGSGDLEVNVTELLDVEISGSGDVCYKGTPVVQSDISGSGDLNNCN